MLCYFHLRYSFIVLTCTVTPYCTPPYPILSQSVYDETICHQSSNLSHPSYFVIVIQHYILCTSIIFYMRLHSFPLYPFFSPLSPSLSSSIPPYLLLHIYSFSTPTLTTPFLTLSHLSDSTLLPVLREVQRESYDNLSLNWQSLDPETLCSMINDNQVHPNSNIVHYTIRHLWGLPVYVMSGNALHCTALPSIAHHYCVP